MASLHSPGRAWIEIIPNNIGCVGQKTKSCSKFSGSLLCEGHIYKDFRNYFIFIFQYGLGVRHWGDQLLKKWIFKLLPVVGCLKLYQKTPDPLKTKSAQFDHSENDGDVVKNTSFSDNSRKFEIGTRFGRVLCTE